MKRWRMLLAEGAFATVCTNQLAGQIAPCELRKFANDPPAREQLGHSVSSAPGCVLIGVPGNDAGLAHGAAFLYRRYGVAWALEEPFRPLDTWEITGFGASVAMSPTGNTTAIGAPLELIPDFIDGSAYVFERSPDGRWIQTAKLIAQRADSDPYRYDFFGCSVAVDDNTILVGAYNDTAAYVFTRGADRQWMQSSRLTPSQGGWYFGFSVAMDGNIAVVGAPNDFTQGQYAGAAFVYERDASGEWRQTARLLPSPGNLLVFGWSVGLSADSILVGAPNDDTNGPSTGAVYVYRRDAFGQWTESQRLYPPNPQVSDSFGGSIAIDGTTAIVGAEGYDGTYFGYGAAFIFCQDPSQHWNLSGTLMAHDPHDGSEFGRALALRGNLAVVGAPFQDEGGVEDAGAAYVFAVGPDANANGLADPCECLFNGDLNLDGVVELADLAILLASFALNDGGDLDGDGQTGLQDLADLLANWGVPCP